MSEELLLEIGTEEIPAAFMPDALAALKSLMGKELSARRIAFKEITTCGTPRRLVLVAAGVAPSQTDLVTQKTGPAKSAAFDKNGNPTKAAEGFAKGQGITVGELKVVTTEKGEYICAERHEKGVLTSSLLPELLPRVIAQLPFPKSMRWKDLEVRFARPIHWILALFSGTVVPFTYGNIQSGSTTCGHRFMAPAPVAVTGVSSYLDMMKKAFVVVDPAQRKKIIIERLRELAKKVGGRPDEDEKLIDEVSFLIESPFPVLCSFEKEFLKLPVEVLITTMKKHQKYFPVFDDQERPLNYFIAVNNTDCTSAQTVISGHERVLRARLADARFFYTEDQKKSLSTFTESLRNVVFQAKLGTSYEKVMRFKALAARIIDALNNPSIAAKVERAAYLCKADLVSEMVGEFPELQGIMGREYARIAGEPEIVAQALFEHYLPRFAGDVLPASDVGAIVSISDKLDTIAGCFGIGLIPTGTADPYALRRQCLGIINIILNKKYTLSLADLISIAVANLKDKITRPPQDICSDVLNFFSGRLANLLTSQGYSYDVVDAILARGIDNLTDIANRVAALQQMKKDPAFESLAVSFKRVVNILRTAQPPTGVNPACFEHEAEKKLYQKYLDIRDRVRELMAQREYLQALQLIATLREAVDNFFDNVLVMAEDMKVRNNRLALINEANSLFAAFADFSKIAAE